MLIDVDTVLCGQVDPALILQARESCFKTDWAQKQYERHEPPLKDGRLCGIPYPMMRDYQRNPTQDQLLLLDDIYPIVDTVLQLFPDRKPVRGEVVNLMPGRRLDLHVDIYWVHKHSKRVHVPIYTNDDCFQIFENREVHLETGNIYEINNRILHSARNSGTEPRFHLILDLMLQEDIDRAANTPGLAGTIVPD